MSRCHRCGWVIYSLWCVNPKCRKEEEAVVSQSAGAQIKEGMGER